MVETKSEQEKRQQEAERLRRNKRLGTWNPSAGIRQKNYLNWLEKQVNQRQKTLDLDEVTHSKAWKAQLRAEKKYFQEEYKRVKDLIEDGGR